MAFAALAATAALSTPALADPPALSEQRCLPGDAAQVTAVDVQDQARIAAGGPGYLVVWEDRRSVLSGYINTAYEPLTGNETDIYAMRLDPAGVPLDAGPLLVCQQGRNQTKPEVAWNEAAQAWLVVWTTERPDWYFFEDVVGARVSAGGQVLDAEPIVLRPENNDPANDYAEYPTVVSDGQQWVVAWVDILWQGQTGRPKIAAKRVDANGTILDANSITLYQHPDNVFGPIYPHLAWGGDQWLVVWERAGFYDIYGKRVSLSLTGIGSEFIITDFGYRPCVASDGTDFLVTSRYNKVHRVTHDGVSLDPNGIALSSPEGQDVRGLDVAWSGSEWRVVNSGGTVFHTVIWLSRISTSGQILGTSAVQETGQNQYRPAIACAGDGSSQVAWGERHTNLDYLENVRSSYVDAAGNGSPVQDLSNGLRRQTHVQFARNGNEVLAVFVSQGGGTTRILAQRVDASGNPIDAEPVEVASAVETMRYPPAVTWNGTYYLVVWAQGGSVLGRRLNAGAAPVDPAPVTLLTDSASAPAVGAVGSSVLLAYTFTFSGDQNYLKGVRVDLSNMSLIGSPAQIGPGFVIPGVRIADFGGRFFVVYEDQGNHDVVSSVITGVFVGVDGLAQPSIQISPTFDEDMPGLAVSGTGAQALVTWSNQNTYPTSAIEGRIVNADGSFATAPFVIADAAGEQLFTTAAWNGEQYVTAWVDYRYVTGVEQLRGDIFAARIDASGSVLDPGGFPVTDGPLPEDLPQLTSGGAGKAILAYTKMHGPGGPEVQRIGYRVIGADVASVGDPHGAGFAAWTLGPVPFRDRLSLSLSGAGSASPAARVEIFSASGRRVVVAPFQSDHAPAGFTWDGRDGLGREVPAGAYFVRVVDAGRTLYSGRTVKVD